MLVTSEGICLDDFLVYNIIRGSLVKHFNMDKYIRIRDLCIEKINYFKNRFYKYLDTITDLSHSQMSDLICYGYITEKNSLNIATDPKSQERMTNIHFLKEQQIRFMEDLKILKAIYQESVTSRIHQTACI